MKTRNLLTTIAKCLKEHTVKLKGTGPRYLIEVNAPSSLQRDFVDTYPEADSFKRLLAHKVGSEIDDQTYGVLIRPDLTYEFAFNRKFADLSPAKDSLEYKTAEEALMGMVGKQKPAQTSERPPQQFDPNTTRIRYSLTGKKKPSTEMLSVVPDSMHGNLVDRIAAHYAMRKVEVVTGKEKPRTMFLVYVEYETSLLDDFKKLYTGEATRIDLATAQKRFGNKKTKNTYGLLISPELRIEFAFNTRFSEYTGRVGVDVVNLPIADALSKVPSQVYAESMPGRIQSLGTVFRYSLQGKKQGAK